eukprot:3195417-Pyramimonas_sp.AAC.3
MVRHTKKDAYGAHTSVSRFEQLRCQGLGLLYAVDTCGLHEQNLGPLRRKAYTIVVGHKGLTTPSHRGAAARLSA